ncbi:hypothetical protein DQM12_10290 [Leuconostoc mesenteroides subsp. mesenteroides]|nr:hypothetical protein [Leuconostoc mesenteroides]RDG11980.1 hypothetical protein DQM12_10290 [Leuconostoc mesenteroides subsp. mesenteroides]
MLDLLKEQKKVSKRLKIRLPKKLSQSLWKPYFNTCFLKFHKCLSFRPIAILGCVILVKAIKLRRWLS